MRQGQVVLATDLLRSQNAVYSLADKSSTFSRAYTAWEDYPATSWGNVNVRRIREVSANVCRCGWVQDENGIWIRGPHLENERINRVLRNTAISDVVWTKTGAAITDVADILPTGGSSSYDVIHEDTSTGQHGISQLASSFSAGDVVLSCFLKILNRHLVRLGTSAEYADFNLSTGEVHAQSGGITDANLRYWGNGYWRCWHVQTISAGGQWCHVLPLDDAGNVSYTGIDQDAIYAYGVQFESGSYPSSLIVTAGSAATRIADSTWQVDAPLPDQMEGWIAGKIMIPSHTPAAEIPILTLSDGGAAADRIRLVATTGGVLELQSAATGGDSGLVTGSTAAVDGKSHSWYITWKPNDLSLVVDDDLEGSDHVVTIPDGLDRLELHPCDGIIGDIQMGDKFNRIPWRIPSAHRSSKVVAGFDALPSNLEINGKSVSPSFLYRGLLATNAQLTASYGSDMPAYEAGDSVFLNQDVDVLNGARQAVRINEGDHYAITSGSTVFGSGDFVIELGIEAGEAVVREKYPISNYYSSAPNRFSLYAPPGSTSYRFYHSVSGVGGSDIVIGTLTPGNFYHIMLVGHRGGFIQAYVNGVAGGIGLCIAGQLYNGRLSIGGGGAWSNKQETAKIAWAAGWEEPDWLDTHLQGDVALARYNIISG